MATITGTRKKDRVDAPTVTPASGTGGELDSLASLLKASADQLRLQILRVMQQDSFSVLELCQILDVKQSALSHHLKLLANARLVITRREGNSIFYRRNLLLLDNSHTRLQQAIFTAVDDVELDASVLKRYQRVQEQRARSSQDFFSRNAGRFQEQQDLIAEFSQYGDSVAEVVQSLSLPEHGLAMEIGPGSGEFLPLLASRFEKVVAVDNSREMLEQGEQKATEKGLDNIHFVFSPVEQLPAKAEADCVISNMVLHHIAGPAGFFSTVAGLLKPGGVLIVTDLCQHNQNWARESCGDLWLGFDHKEMIHWAQAAGMEHENSHFLAMRNGFQVQICRFTKTANGN